MTLQERIKADLTQAIRDRDEVRKNTIRVVLGEMGRGTEKVIADDDVVRILKKLIKSEKEVLERQGKSEPSAFIEIIEQYLPQMADETEIISWIQSNIDLSAYKNNMQAMAPIMKHFGSRADGSTVKKILQAL